MNVLEDKKGEDILLIDIHEISDFSDYFIICNGTSERMLTTLAEDVVKYLKNNHDFRGNIEGEARDGWILIDFGDIIVHLFSPESRNYYQLEELWGYGNVLLRLH